MTRLLDRFGPDLARLSGAALGEAVLAAEGRTVMAEVIAPAPPLLSGTANAELMAAFGADLICINLVDPGADGPLVGGLEQLDPAPDGFAGLARLLGRPVGLNLEPDLESVPGQFRATADQARTAASRGAAFVMITANPGREATISDMETAVATVRQAAPDLWCLAGKMHQAGAEEPLGADTAARLVAAGAQGVLVPLPGTVPGLSERTAEAMVRTARADGGVAVGTIGTSQEGADPTVLRQLALTAKRIGVDVHHIGDGGWTGLAPPENIYAYATTIRGVRHTWNRMARNARAGWTGIDDKERP
ncbi:MAG TPA: hypothetical protein VML96_00405 [Egibacteraceae bacterium]|nr:hypothetical protein [Egibacteraceae bacterium]